jgi:SAM-dependent methyltransferase
MALAMAIMRCFGYTGLLKNFVLTRLVRTLSILEVNRAGRLTKYFQQIKGHVLQSYPDIDLVNLKFSDCSFDLVIHSDTLEHILEPVKGLSECYRVLKPKGFCVFTIPVIVDRLTRSRCGLGPSYHGEEGQNQEDYLVHTEYGSDAWRHVILSGFPECRIYSLEYPAAQALAAVK